MSNQFKKSKTSIITKCLKNVLFIIITLLYTAIMIKNPYVPVVCTKTKLINCIKFCLWIRVRISWKETVKNWKNSWGSLSIIWLGLLSMLMMELRSLTKSFRILFGKFKKSIRIFIIFLSIGKSSMLMNFDIISKRWNTSMERSVHS